MGMQYLEIILSNIELSESKDSDYKIKGLATLTGETATALIDAVLLRPSADQAALLERMSPGHKLNVAATPLQRGSEALWIIDDVFSEAEWTRIKEEAASEAMMGARAAILKNLDFLAWVDRCTFPADLERELVELGVSEETALDLRFNLTAQRGRVKTIVELYQDCITSGEDTQAIATYLESMHRQYESIIQKTASNERPHAHSESEPGL